MKRILVVDDEFDIADAVRNILEDEGYHVEVSGSGLQGLEYLQKERPDLLILDVMMPGLTGPELLREARRMPSLEGMPVILMSAVRPPEKERPDDWQAFLPKPFTLMSLLDMVEAEIGPPHGGPR